MRGGGGDRDDEGSRVPAPDSSEEGKSVQWKVRVIVAKKMYHLGRLLTVMSLCIKIDGFD